jgi:hypothetical protein
MPPIRESMAAPSAATTTFRAIVSASRLNQRYVFFYLPVPSSEGGPQDDVWLYQAWPIGSDDLVQTSLDGPIPLLQLEPKIAQTPLCTPPPTS